MMRPAIDSVLQSAYAAVQAAGRWQFNPATPERLAAIAFLFVNVAVTAAAGA